MASVALEETKKDAGGDAPPIGAGTLRNQTEEVFAKCDCCGLTEECTPAYIDLVREKHCGRWICGLCSEAVKEERKRLDEGIGKGEALDRHMKICQQFRSSSPPSNTAEELITAMKHLLRRTLVSPKKTGSSCKEATSFIQSKSCFSTELKPNLPR